MRGVVSDDEAYEIGHEEGQHLVPKRGRPAPKLTAKLQCQESHLSMRRCKLRPQRLKHGTHMLVGLPSKLLDGTQRLSLDVVASPSHGAADQASRLALHDF